MGEEMGIWRKAISQGRDRRQSKALVWVVGVVLVALCFQTALFAYALAGRFPGFVFSTLWISVGFAVIALALRAATLAGAMFGGMICLLLVFWTGQFEDSPLHSGLTPLVLLFLLTFVATRLGRQRKAAVGLAEGRGGRSASQVIANLGVAGVISSWMGASALLACIRGVTPDYDTPLQLVGAVVLATLVEATADTVSSEIGQAFGGAPVMLTTMQRVEPGTDGAVSVLGSVAGVAAGGFVTLAGMWAMRLPLRNALIAFVAGVAGLFFDSLLGATFERRGWLGNDLVNFASTLFASLVALGLMIVGGQRYSLP